MALDTSEDKNKKKVSAKKLQKSYFDVLGLCCSSEVPLIENILKSLDGVKDYAVIVPTRTVIVFHDNLLVSQLQIVKALNQARLEANIRVQGDASYQKKWPSPFAVLSGVLLLLSLLKFVYHPLHWLALGAVAVGIIPIILKAVASIRNVRLDTNILVLIAVIGTIALKDYIEAGTIVFLFTIAEWLESRASHKANATMSSLMNMAPQKAVIAETGEEVDADEVKLNTVLAVKAGEVIPIDGVVVDGKSEVDEKTLTGESFPVPKQKDSTVWAGTMNLNGYISVKTTALAEDCVVAKMAKLVEEAQNSKSKTQRFIDKCAQYYTPAVIVTSACLVVVPLILRVHNKNHFFHLALVVLVSACPCALILSTPVATFCALTKAATSGLLIKGGDYLELLAKIKIIAFDKTGTITRGEFVVTDFRSLCSDFSLETLLYWVSSIESKSSHPMAAALVDYTRSFSIEPKPDNVEEFQNFPGEGIHGKIDGKDIYIGNRRIARRAGGDSVPVLENDVKRGTTIGCIYIGETACGIFSLSDACRTGVAEAIKDLKKLGIKSTMLTGDSQSAAVHAQEQLGEYALEAVHAELLPEDKATIIKSFKKEGPTAMIGDGVNDAPALATADIGISMGISGSALATETGHVILMSNDIRKIPKAIQLARRAHRKVIENVIVSIATKSAILALAVAGHPLVWAAVLADVGTCLLVIFNSMLLLRGKHEHAGKCCKSSAALHSHKHSDNHASHNSKNCCKSSAQLHTHKNSDSHASHNHKNCCPKPKTENSCKRPQQFPMCNSKCQPNHHKDAGSCRSTNCGSLSTKMPKADVHKHEPKQCCDHKNNQHDIEANNQERQCCNHGGCETNNQHDVEANDQERQCHDHGGCETNIQYHIEANDPEKQCHSSEHENMSSCQNQVVEHVHHSHCKTDTYHGISHHSVELEQNMRNHKNCHSHNESSSSSSIFGIGCGKSCRCYVKKKCCGNHGEHGTGFGGGLSEITIE